MFIWEASIAPSCAFAREGWITKDFESEQLGESPVGFSFGRTGKGRLGRWVVLEEKDTPSGKRVLAQTDADPTDYRFPVAVVNEPVLKDLKVAVQCKPVSGQVDQAAGIVFRFQDENNYYVTRANALENNVRLYRVANGRREQLAGWDGLVKTGVWHAYAVEVQGNRFQVFWDGQKVIDARDDTFSQPGKVGVWTKADSITDFDDLKIEPR